MRVVLINSPYFDIYGSLNVGRNHTMSLGLGYIAAFLRQAGHDVLSLDPEPLNMSLNEIRHYLLEKRPDMVGISAATANFMGAVKLAGVTRDVLPHIPIVVGGVHASALPELTLNQHPEFDIVVIGEGEETMLKLCCAIEKKESLDEINGLAFKRDGKIVRTNPAALIEDIDKLPFPARDLVDLNLYRPQVHLYRGRKSATMITSRGCPARCTYCATQVTMGNRFRMHSAEYVISEIEHLVDNYGIEDIIFVDDTFTINKERAKKICNMLIEKKINIGWFCFVRVNDASEELFSLMKKAGCFSMFFGVESANDQILKNIKKGATVSQAENALRIANKLRFKTLAGFMFGNPGETTETIEQTIKFSLKLNPIIGSFNVMVPFPGTEEYQRYIKKHPGEIMNWASFIPKGITPLIETEELSKKVLQRYLSMAYLKFYLRPSQIWRILSNISSFTELWVYIRGAFGLFRRVFEWKTSKNI